MSTRPDKEKRITPSEFISRLSFKLGSAFFGTALGGLLAQYMSGNPTGMLIFAGLGFLGLILVATSIVAGE